MTSNLGSDLIQGNKELDYNAMKEAVMSVVGQHFDLNSSTVLMKLWYSHPLVKEKIFVPLPLFNYNA